MKENKATVYIRSQIAKKEIFTMTKLFIKVSLSIILQFTLKNPLIKEKNTQFTVELNIHQLTETTSFSVVLR